MGDAAALELGDERAAPGREAPLLEALDGARERGVVEVAEAHHAQASIEEHIELGLEVLVDRLGSLDGEQAPDDLLPHPPRTQ